LRARLRARRRVSVPVAIAAFATIALVVLAIRPRVENVDREAVRDMLSTERHPDAIRLGIVERPASTFAEDPRVSSDVVVFRWVPPAQPPKAAP
jgi:hypothetical protein